MRQEVSDQARCRSTQASSNSTVADPHLHPQLAHRRAEIQRRFPEAMPRRGSRASRGSSPARICTTTPSSSANSCASAGRRARPAARYRGRNGRRTPFPAASRTGRRRSGHGRRSSMPAARSSASAAASCVRRAGSSRSAGSSPSSPYTCASAEATEAIAPAAQIDEPQRGRALVQLQRRRERAAHIRHRRERRDDERHRRDDALLLTAPRARPSSSTASPCPPESRSRAPGHSSLPTACTVAYSAASSPGSPQAAIQLADSRTCDSEPMSAARMLVIASADRQPSRGRRIEHRHRRALAHGHRLAARGRRSPRA